MSDDAILLGIPWTDASKASLAFEAAGAPGLSFGNVINQARAIIDYINAHGGAGGRRLEAVFHEQTIESNSSTEGTAREGQEMCATFTEDHQVFAIMTAVRGNPVVTDCAARSGTREIASLLSIAVDQHRVDQVFEHFYQVHHMTIDRRDRAYVDGLVRLGFFSPDAKIGLLVYDDPAVRRSTEQALKPALAAHGLSVASEALYTREGFFGSTNPWPNMVLQFQTTGVTHVLFSATDQLFGPPVWFMRTAENQLYRPRYGVASDIVPAFLPLGAPSAQLKGAIGVGWRPDNDGAVNGIEELWETPNTQLCRQIMRDAGEPEFPAAGTQYCEGLFFLKAVLDQPGASPYAFPAAVQSLGRSYHPVLAFGSYFGPGRHDGGFILRDVAFDEGCRAYDEYSQGSGCFMYTSGPYEIP